MLTVAGALPLWIALLLGGVLAVGAILFHATNDHSGRHFRASRCWGGLVATLIGAFSLEWGIAWAIALLAGIEFFYELRRAKKLAKKDAEDPDSEYQRRAHRLRFQARVFLILALLTLLSLINWGVFRYLTPMNVVICTIGFSVLAALLFAFGSDVDKDKTRCATIRTSSRWKYWKQRRHTWALPLMMPLVGFIVLTYAWSWALPGTSPWWFLGFGISIACIAACMLLHTLERRKRTKWLTIILGPMLVVFMGLTSQVTYGHASEVASEITAAEDGLTDPKTASDELICSADEAVSQTLPNAAYSADEVLASYTPALLDFLQQKGLAGNAMKADDLQEQGGGCLSELGRELYDQLIEATTPAEREAYWTEYCRVNGCPTG